MNLGYRFKIIIKTPEDGQLWFSRIFICLEVIQYINIQCINTRQKRARQPFPFQLYPLKNGAFPILAPIQLL